jgi:hypothetical protein
MDLDEPIGPLDTTIAKHSPDKRLGGLPGAGNEMVAPMPVPPPHPAHEWMDDEEEEEEAMPVHPLDAVIARHWPGKSLAGYTGLRDGLNPHVQTFIEYITGREAHHPSLPGSKFGWGDSVLCYHKDMHYYLTPLGVERLVPLLVPRTEPPTPPSVGSPPAHERPAGAPLRHVRLPWISAEGVDTMVRPASIDPPARLEGTKITLRTSGSSTVTPTLSHLEQALQAVDPCNDGPKKACLTTGCRRPAEDGKDMCTPCIAALQLETDSLDAPALAPPLRREPKSTTIPSRALPMPPEDMRMRPLQQAVLPKKGCITPGCRRLAEDGKDVCTQCATELQNDSDSLSGSTPIPSRRRSGTSATTYRNKVWRVELTLYSEKRDEHRRVDWPFLIHIPVEEVVPSEVRYQFVVDRGALFVSVLSKTKNWLSHPIFAPADWEDKPKDDEISTLIVRYDASKLAQASGAKKLKGGPCDEWRVDLELASTGETISVPLTFKCPYVVKPGDFEFLVREKDMIEGTCSIYLKEYEWNSDKFPLPDGVTKAAHVKNVTFTRLTPSKFPVDEEEEEKGDGACPYLDARGERCTVMLANPDAPGCVRHMCIGCRAVIAENGSTRCAACVGTLRGIQRRATLPMAKHVIELLSQKIKDGGKEWARFLTANTGADKEPFTDGHPTSPAFTRKGVLLALEFYHADLTLLAKIFPVDDPKGERREKPLKRRHPEGEADDEEGEHKAKKAKPMA